MVHMGKACAYLRTRAIRVIGGANGRGARPLAPIWVFSVSVGAKGQGARLCVLVGNPRV